MNVCRADECDLPEILILQKKAFYEGAVRYNNFEMQPMTQTLEEMTGEFKNMIFYKVVECGQIVGSVRLRAAGENGYIYKLIVDPAKQNRGIGAELMLFIEKDLKSVKRLELYTGCRDEKNLYFYNKIGYKKFKEVPHGENFYFVYMEKFL